MTRSVPHPTRPTTVRGGGYCGEEQPGAGRGTQVFAPPTDHRLVAPLPQQHHAVEPAAHLNLVDLVDRARAGDPDAWVVLYRRAYPSLLAYATTRLGRPEAEDAVSETMTRAVRNIATFRWQGVDFSGWLFGIHRHVVADAQRVRCRRPATHAPDRDEHQPLEAVVRDDEHTMVRRMFQRLNPKEQELLHLRVIAGLSVEEVATILGKRPGAVRVAQSRALARLRTLMREAEACV